MLACKYLYVNVQAAIRSSKAPAVNSNVDDWMDSSSAMVSTSVSKGRLQASDSRPKYTLRDGLPWLLSITTGLTTAVLVGFSIGGTHADLAMLHGHAGAYHGGSRACVPSGLQGLLYASGYAQALPVLVLLLAWFLAVQPARCSQRVYTLTSAMRLHACRTFAVMLPCAALVALQPLVIISWAAFGGDMKGWEIEGRLHDGAPNTQSAANAEGGYECCASELLPWGSDQTAWAQLSCICGFVACAWYLVLGACFAVMPSKPRLFRAVFGQLPDDDGVAAAAADVCEERMCTAKDPDSMATDPDDDSVANVVDLVVEDGVTKPGQTEAR
eukprot:jgi/Ulvmu1/6440/UM003_0069.1